MKLNLTEMVGKRPYKSSFWIILLAVPSLIVFIGIDMLLWKSQSGQIAIHLLPPFIWLAGGMIVLVWLLVLRRMWQPQPV